jgi:hypothetical protein
LEFSLKAISIFEEQLLKLQEDTNKTHKIAFNLALCYLNAAIEHEKMTNYDETLNFYTKAYNMGLH